MKRFFLCLLAICMLLSGCSLFDSNKYEVTPHLDQSGEPEEEVISVRNYSQLYAELVKLVHEGVESAVINVPDYSRERLPGDLETAVYCACNQDAIGAYAVENITWDVGTSGFVAAVALEIDYIHGREELMQIQKADNMDAVLEMVGSALERCDAGIILHVSRYTDMDLIQMVEDYAVSNPDTVMEIPEVTLDMYPEAGVQRVVSMKFTYQNSRNDLRQMQMQVSQIFDSASLYVSGSESEMQKLSQLYAFLMERFTVYQLKTSITPSYSLLLHGVGDSHAFAMVYAKMCSLSGLECRIVTGTRDGEPWSWNMVKSGDQYHHVDLLQCSAAGKFAVCTDSEMENYVWDYSSYPAFNGEYVVNSSDFTE